MTNDEIDKEIKKLEADITDISEREKMVHAMSIYAGDDEIISSTDYIAAMARLRGNSDILKIMSGFPSLDAITEGFWEGNVVVISGPTKEGKTTLCQSFTINMEPQQILSLWFPFDTPGEELILRFTNPPLMYLPRKNAAEKKLDWIEKKVIEGIAKYGIRAIFIDHLGMLMKVTDNTSNYSTEMSSVMMELKEIAIKWRIVVFLNHHIRKIQADTVPNYQDLKDSSAVASDSDMVLMVWRKKSKREGIITHENKAIVAVQTNRRTGKTGIVQLIHAGDHFEEEGVRPVEVVSRLKLSDIFEGQ